MKQDKSSVFDEVVDTIEIKGKKYSVYMGKKGGKYYYNDNGKKAYVKESTPKQPKGKVEIKTIDLRKKPEVIPTLKRYIGFFVNINKEGLKVDDFKEWCEAYSEAEARQKFESDYASSIARGTIELSMIWEDHD